MRPRPSVLRGNRRSGGLLYQPSRADPADRARGAAPGAARDSARGPRAPAPPALVSVGAPAPNGTPAGGPGPPPAPAAPGRGRARQGPRGPPTLGGRGPRL